MKDEKAKAELEAALNKLPPDDKEFTEYLLESVEVYKSIKPAFKPTIDEIDKRAREKNITFNEARRELRREARHKQEKIVAMARRLNKSRLSENVRNKLGIRDSGRPKGSKNKDNKNDSKVDFYRKLKQLAKSKDKAGEELTQREAAIALGLGGVRQLRRKLREDYEDTRKWKTLVQDLLAE